MNFEFFKQFITKPEIDEIIIGIGVENVSFFFSFGHLFSPTENSMLDYLF